MFRFMFRFYVSLFLLFLVLLFVPFRKKGRLLSNRGRLLNVNVLTLRARDRRQLSQTQPSQLAHHQVRRRASLQDDLREGSSVPRQLGRKRLLIIYNQESSFWTDADHSDRKYPDKRQTRTVSRRHFIILYFIQ